MEKFAIGFLVGGALGALLVANNHKMRALVKKAQEDTQAKMDAFMDEKINAMEQCVKETKERAQEKIEEGKEKLSKKAKKQNA